MAFNVNAYDSDLINLDDFILDLNTFEAAKLIYSDEDPNKALHCILFLKNGHIHMIKTSLFHKLKEYCRQS
jgi:hypothetical protein